jgi:hypothetical protein
MNQMETKGLLHDTKSQTRGLFFIHLILLVEQPLPAQYARNIGHMIQLFKYFVGKSTNIIYLIPVQMMKTKLKTKLTV